MEIADEANPVFNYEEFSLILQKHGYKVSGENGFLQIRLTFKLLWIVYAVLIFICISVGGGAYVHRNNTDADALLYAAPAIITVCIFLLIFFSLYQFLFSITLKKEEICKNQFFSSTSYVQEAIEKYVLTCTPTKAYRSSLVACYTYRLFIRLKNGKSISVLYFDTKEEASGHQDMLTVLKGFVYFLPKQAAQEN